MKLIFASLLISSLSWANFILEYPEPRGYNENQVGEFPCGGQNAVSSTRTLFPIKGGAISLVMGDHKSKVEALTSFDSNPTTAFNTILRPTFTETGFGRFCMIDVDMPDDLDIAEGQNATIQVIVSNETGSFYSCADISFSISAFVYATCTNSTGVTANSENFRSNANETKSSAATITSTLIWGFAAYSHCWSFGFFYIVATLVAAGVIFL